MSEKCACKRLAVKRYYGVDYCLDCFHKEIFGTLDVFDYLKKNNMSFMQHSIPNVILVKKNKELIMFLTEIEFTYKCDWWQLVNYPDNSGIEIKKGYNQ